MPAILRAEGKDFDVISYMRATGFKPSAIFLKSQFPKLAKSAIHLTLSSSDEWNQQLTDSLDFLKKNETALRQLSQQKDVEKLILDVSIKALDTKYPKLDLPKQFLRYSSSLELDIEISIFSKER